MRVLSCSTAIPFDTFRSTIIIIHFADKNNPYLKIFSKNSYFSRFFCFRNPTHKKTRKKRKFFPKQRKTLLFGQISVKNIFFRYAPHNSLCFCPARKTHCKRSTTRSIPPAQRNNASRELPIGERSLLDYWKLSKFFQTINLLVIQFCHSVLIVISHFTIEFHGCNGSRDLYSFRS